LIVVTVLSTLVVSRAVFASAEENRRDGNWWKTQDVISKLNYMTGFFDGMELGNKFSYWDTVKEKNSSCSDRSIQSYTKYKNKYVSNVTNGQLVDGVDEFYSDYRNRRITVDNAVWLVMNEIGGTPRAQIEKMIENWRRYAD